MLALVTASIAAGRDPDLELLVDAFAAFGESLRIESWDDPAVGWDDFDAVVLRSTWDYPDRLDEFLGWLARASESTVIVNPVEVVRWNVDKHYLGDLDRDGIPIVPTTFVEVGESPSAPTSGSRPTDSTWVVKPTVGADARGATRCAHEHLAGHVAALHADGHAAMVQPYLDLIDERSETSLIFVGDLDGLEFSHAVAKAALLGRTNEEGGDGKPSHDAVTARVPTDDEVAFATHVLDATSLRRFGPLAYARVDVVPTADGPVLMELELVEPSLYFETANGSADRAARAWAAYLGR